MYVCWQKSPHRRWRCSRGCTTSIQVACHPIGMLPHWPGLSCDDYATLGATIHPWAGIGRVLAAQRCTKIWSQLNQYQEQSTLHGRSRAPPGAAFSIPDPLQGGGYPYDAPRVRGGRHPGAPLLWSYLRPEQYRRLGVRVKSGLSRSRRGGRLVQFLGALEGPPATFGAQLARLRKTRHKQRARCAASTGEITARR